MFTYYANLTKATAATTAKVPTARQELPVSTDPTNYDIQIAQNAIPAHPVPVAQSVTRATAARSARIATAVSHFRTFLFTG